MTDYRVEAKFRNARLLAAFERIGETPTGFAKSRGLSITRTCAIVAMTKRPVDRNGDWWPEVMALCDAASVMPCDMFNEKQMDGFEKTSFSKDVDESLLAASEFNRMQLSATPICDREENIELASKLFYWITEYNPRYAKAVSLHSDGLTFDEIGSELGVTRERARQIVTRSHRMMKNYAKKRLGIDNLAGAFKEIIQ
jgi:hypothetical protein